MRTNSKRTQALLFAALAAAVIFNFTSPAISAVPNSGDNSQMIGQAGPLGEGALLAKSGRAVDDFPTVPRNRGRFGPTRLFNDDGDLDDISISKVRRRVDDAPKPHIGPHKLMEDGDLDDFSISKVRRRVDDAPKPHIGPHKLMEDFNSDEMILAKGAKKRPAIDAPTRKAPHPPGAVHG